MFKVNMQVINKLLILVIAVSLLLPFCIGPVHAEEQTITRTFSTTLDDGYIYQVSPISYDVAWGATSGFMVMSGATGIFGGQRFSGISYYVYRTFLFFDTSIIPVTANITSAIMSIYVYIDNSTQDFDAVIQNGQPYAPHLPLISEDYYQALYSGNGGSKSTSTIGGVGYWNITLNTSGKSWILEGGTTKLALRSSRDINKNTPTGEEFVRYYAYEKGETYSPKLYVTYTATGNEWFLFGSYNEYGLRNGAINVTYQNFVNSTITFELNGNDTLISDASGGVLRFDLGSNLTRTFYLRVGGEDIYVFKPEGYVVYFYFAIYDLIGIKNGYLESLINVNGTDRIVERWKVTSSTLPFLLNVGFTYKIRLVCDQGTYIFGEYPAISQSQTYTLTVTNTMFPSTIITTYRYVHIYASRTFNATSIITAHYEDLLDATISVAMKIKTGNGTVIYDVTVYEGNEWNYVFDDLDNETDYTFDATVSHSQAGTMYWRQLLPHEYVGTGSPFDLGWLGPSAPIVTAYIIPLFIMLALGGTFSVVNKELGVFIFMAVAMLFSAMGWFPLPAGLIVTALAIVIMIALLKGKKGESILQ